MNNAEWLSKDIERLADAVNRASNCRYCAFKGKNICYKVGCIDGIKQWLSAEHKEAKCGNCVYLEKDDGSPYCMLMDLYTERGLDDDACDDFVEQEG